MQLCGSMRTCAPVSLLLKICKTTVPPVHSRYIQKPFLCNDRLSPLTCEYVLTANISSWQKQRYNHLQLTPQVPLVLSTRSTVGFYNKLPAVRLWKGLTGVSNAGRKKGRGKGSKRKPIKNLHRGQYLGEGSVNIVWPGLNAPIFRGKELVKQRTLPSDEERKQRLIDVREKMGMRRSRRLNPLERGWSGNKLPGKWVGPPDPVGEDRFEGFDTVVLELKTVSHMDGRLGRKRMLSMFAVVGNKNGLAGFALVKNNGNSASLLRACKTKAAKRLVYIERYDDHTVFHDFACKYLETQIFVNKKPEGYGLVCHRVIKAICEAIGIKNLHATVDGSTNVQKITKAFFLGLLNQRTHKQLAEEKGLHLVRLRAGDYPHVVASPETTSVRTRDQIPMDEELDFKLYTMDGKVEMARKPYEPFYIRLPSYEKYLRKQLKCRNHEKIKLQQMTEYGSVVSFLTEKYPECNPQKKIAEEED